MIRRPPRSTHCISSAASDVYKRQNQDWRALDEMDREESRRTGVSIPEMYRIASQSPAPTQRSRSTDSSQGPVLRPGPTAYKSPSPANLPEGLRPPMRGPPPRRVKQEVKEESDMTTATKRCHACDVLSINGPMQCMQCLKCPNPQPQWIRPDITYATHWMEADLSPDLFIFCLLYTSPSPRDVEESRMPSSA